jgi:hypothetical protein
MLGLGTSAWAAAALTKDLKVTGYEAVNLFDFQNKNYDGTALSSFDDLPGLGVSAQNTVGAAYGSNNWYDDTVNSHGLRLQSGGGRWIQFTVDIKKDDYIIINGGAASEAYEISMTNGESVSVTEASDYLCFKATQDAENLKLTVHRYNYLLQILIMTKDASTETADYTINYKASGETVKTVSGNEAVGTVISVLSSFFEGGKKYYTDAEQPTSLTVAKGGSTLNINVTEAAQYTCTVNAKVGDVLLATEEESVYDGENVTVYYQMAYAKDGKWYFIDKNGSAPGYGVAFNGVTSNQTENKTTYTLNEDVVYFGEAEDMTLFGSFAADGNYLTWRSNGGAKRLGVGAYIYSNAVASGVYDVTLWARNNRSAGDGTETLPIFLRDEDGNLTDLEVSFPGWNRGGFEDAKTATITIPDDGKSYSVVIYNNTAYNSNLELDYLYITKKIVSKDITEAGWATYCSPYALDLKNASGLTDAYIITGGENKVVSTESVMSGTVPANTGLLLKGAKGTVTIPVVASSSTVISGNKLIGVTADTPIAAEAGWVLMGSPKVGFYKNANAFTVGANTAYLPVGFDGDAVTAPTFYGLFDGNVTGISATLVNSEKVNSEIYNLAGQRVAAPTKGLYIVNGKKVVIK